MKLKLHTQTKYIKNYRTILSNVMLLNIFKITYLQKYKVNNEYKKQNREKEVVYKYIDSVNMS